MLNSDSTGRDGYIVIKSFSYAAAYISTLPSDKQEYGDMTDMLRLLRAFGEHQWNRARDSVVYHTGVDINAVWGALVAECGDIAVHGTKQAGRM